MHHAKQNSELVAGLSFDAHAEWHNREGTHAALFDWLDQDALAKRLHLHAYLCEPAS